MRHNPAWSNCWPKALIQPTEHISCLSPITHRRVVVPAAEHLCPHWHRSQQRCSIASTDRQLCGGDVVGSKGGSYSIGRPGVCCLPTASAAASGAGVQGGGTVKEGGQKSSLAPGNASLGHLISLIRTDSQGFLFQTFFPLPSSARVQISTVAHPQLLCSVIPWTTLLSAVVVQTPSQGKSLELPSPVSLANVVLLDEYKKAPVSTSYGYFRSTVVRSTIMNSSIFFLLYLAI